MRRVLLALFVAAASASVAAIAQGQPDVKLTVQTRPLIRGRGSVVPITIEIPPGHYIPGETRGSLTGPWLQAISSGLIDRDLPTWPRPDAVRLPGADVKVLAYAGRIALRLMLDVAPGMTDEVVGFRLGHQLCDRTACRPFTTSEISVPMRFEAPPPPEAYLTFKRDGTSVAILTGPIRRYEAALPYTPMPQTFVRPLAELPDGHPARAEFKDDTAVNSTWTVASRTARFSAIGERPAGFNGGCDDSLPLALVARTSDRTLASERAKYFLAFPSRTAGNKIPRNVAVPFQLSDRARADLEAVIDQQMRITLPGVFAPLPFGNAWKPAETSYDRSVRAGAGRLRYHLEAYRLAPDDDARLYVRAFWQVGPVAETGLTLWIRFDGQRFVVERSNAAVSRMARYTEMRHRGSNLAERPEYAGMLLNVIPADDGWAYVLIGQQGYESFGVTVLKYSPDGPVDTGIGYGYGC